jgi:hypothetical protein
MNKTYFSKESLTNEEVKAIIQEQLDNEAIHKVVVKLADK